MRVSTPIAKMLSLILGASLFATRAVLADPNAPCYFPGGALAPGYFACHAFGAEVSSCCAPGWTCFSNSLCIATTETRSWPNISIGAVQRGACTAPKWNNEFCGGVCLTGDGADGKLAACGNDRYCCWSDFEAGKCSCDDNEGGSFVIKQGLPQTIIQVTDTTFTGSPSISVVTTKPTPRPTTDSTSASTTGSTLTTSVTSVTGASAAATSTSTETAKPPKGDGNRTLKIALGVAIPVAVIIIATAAIFFILRRRRELRGGGEGEMDTAQPQYVDNPISVNDGLAETHRYAPARSFGQHYNAYDVTGSANKRS